MNCKRQIDYRIWCKTRSIMSQPHQMTKEQVKLSLYHRWGKEQSMERRKTIKCSRIMPVHLRLSLIQTIWCSINKSKWVTRTAINSNLSCANIAKINLRMRICMLEMNIAIPRKGLTQKETYWLLVSTTSLCHMLMQGTSHWRICMRVVRNKMELQWVQ